MAYPRWLPVLLGVLSAVGPVSTDMYLPAFPALEAALGGGVVGSAQLTLATWFVGLAVGQITQGSLSDRFGRRGPLIVGTAIYTVASVGCALSPDLITLSAFRFLAAFGGSAAMVIPRAIVRDISEGTAAARLMSQLILVLGAAPILAPTLGGLVLGFASWHAIFWIATLYGFICCVLVWWKLPDTLPLQGRIELRPFRIATRMGRIMTERGFITHALLGGLCMCATFAYLGGAPDVFEGRFHLSPVLFGAMFGVCACGYIGSAQISPMLLGRVGPSRMMRYAVRVMVCTTGTMLLVAMTLDGPWWLLAACILATFCCMGFITPNATVGALTRHAGHAGSASALLGMLQFLLGAVSGMAVGLLADGTARPMAALMFTGAVAAAIADAARPPHSSKPLHTGIEEIMHA